MSKKNSSNATKVIIGCFIIILFAFGFRVFQDYQQKQKYLNKIENLQSQLTFSQQQNQEKVKGVNTELENEVEEKRKQLQQIAQTSDSSQNTKTQPGKKTQHSECSTENPPKVYIGKGGNTLDLCGTKTKYKAQILENENLILFIDDKVNEVRFIETQKPFTEYSLLQNISLDTFPDFYNKVYSNSQESLYIWQTKQSNNQTTNTFLFDARTKNFIVASSQTTPSTSSIEIQSSNTASPYIAFHNKNTPNYTLKNEDILYNINGKITTVSQEANNESSTNPLLFSCAHPDLQHIESTSKVFEIYIQNTPEKFPCFKNVATGETYGFFDLENNTFLQN